MKTSSLMWSFGLMAFAVLGFGYLESRGRDLGEVYELPKPSPAAVVAGACQGCGELEGLVTRVEALESRVSALESVSAVRRSVVRSAAPALVAAAPVVDAVPGHWTIRDVPASRASMSQIVSHLAEHGVSASGSREELLALHDSLHEGGSMAAAPVAVVRSTPAVVRSTYRSAPARGFRLFGSRARTCPAGGCP